MAKQILNQLPAPTFSWLHVNAAEREICEEIAETVTVSGAGSAPVRIDIEKSTDVTVTGAQNPQFVIMHITAERAKVSTGIRAESGETVRLVQIFKGGETVADLHAELAENASLELVQIYLNCSDAVSGIQVDMNGRKSAFTSNIGYYLSEGNALDINLNIIQNGKKSESKTNVRGVLRDNAKKVFRGTIDFRKGAAGAVGTELEHVILTDEAVHNQTVPVILCEEEDVVGSHGASIGRIGQDQIFYMQSRGIPEEQIYEILAQSQISSTVKQIGDAEAEKLVNELLGRENADE